LSAKWLVRASFRHNCPSFVPRAICTGGPHRPHVAGFLGDSGCIIRRGEAYAISRFGESDLSMKRHVADPVRRRTPQQFDRPHSRAEGWPATGGHAILGLHLWHTSTWVVNMRLTAREERPSTRDTRRTVRQQVLRCSQAVNGDVVVVEMRSDNV